MLTPCVRTGCIWAVVSPDVWKDCTLPGVGNRGEPFGTCKHDQDTWTFDMSSIQFVHASLASFGASVLLVFIYLLLHLPS
jgi:hypothetical protein